MTDCPLCPGQADEGRFQPELLGMFVCTTCAKRWHVGSWMRLPDVDAVAWCRQVHYMKLKHLVDTREARRLVLAAHLNLKVDTKDLQEEWRPPWMR